MSLQIIFPNEEKMNIKNLDNLKGELYQLLTKNMNQPYLEDLNRYLGEIQGYLLVADRKNLKEYFDYFCKLNFLDIFNTFLEKRIERITFSILAMISFLTVNIQNKELLDYIYDKKYPTRIPGQQMNIIDKLISLDAKKNEEYLTYQINFIKSLTLKINIKSLNYFYDSNINQFPILTKSLSLYNYNDPLIRNVVKNIFLAIIKIEHPNLREFLISFPINLYYPNVIFQLKNTIMKLCLIDLGEDGGSKSFGKLQKEHDFIVDAIFYISDLLSLNIEKINFILINCLINEIILPLIFVIVNQKNDNITLYHSLYIIGLFLFTLKNEFLINIISYILFTEKIPNTLFYKLSSSPFTIINKNFMDIINFLITNSSYADINEPDWQKIKNYMRNTNGIDLSIGEISKENIYDYFKDLIYTNEGSDYIKNPIFENIKTFFICNDDAIILILNLIINFCIKFYKDLPEQEKSNSKDSDKKNALEDEDEDEDDGFNLINDDEDDKNIIEQPKNDDKNNDKKIYNLMNNKFFEIDLNNENTENILNQLFKYLKSLKSFRLATSEIILYNTMLLIKKHLEKNNNNPQIKRIIILKLLSVIDEKFAKMNNLLEKDKNLNKHLFDCALKAYDYYIKNIDKKINDLITLPNI